ncbi:MAG TPA: NlpC/P60 family protein, partial [Chthonomonadaceae bacterium]|nr:NlpC/P60 family protein [Chthonomonadaceae bacterium]
MNRNGFRWTHLCVSATTALFAGSAWNAAGASQVHVLQHGETLSAIARKYHISVQDIIAANALSHPDSVPDGRRLVIPDPPKRFVLPTTMHRTTLAKSDRVNVRLGPSGDYRSIWMFDLGATVVVTAERDGWAQVALPDGRNGWVRQDFLKTGGHNEPVRQANTPKPNHGPKPAPVVALAPERSRRGASTRPAGASAGTSRKSHETQLPPKVAHHSVSSHAKEQASHHSHPSNHVAQAAHHSHHADHMAAHHSSHSSRHGGHYVPEADAPDSDSDIVRTAYAYRGTPYHYGASGRGGFDCSGFTSYIYGKKGVSLPHSARGQFEEGRKVSRDDLKPGDLVFFHTVTSGISHVGMYVGNGKFVHCSSRRSGGVRVDSLDSGYYS